MTLLISQEKLNLLKAIFSFDPRLASIDVARIQSELAEKEEFSISQIIDEVSNTIKHKDGQQRFISYCFLLSYVDGSLSQEEIDLINALREKFGMTETEAAKLEEQAKALTSTLQELQILQKDVL